MSSSRIKAAMLWQAHYGADLNPADAITSGPPSRPVPQAALLLYIGRGRSPAVDRIGLIDEGYEPTSVALHSDIFAIPAND
jgi:hypothetical protein